MKTLLQILLILILIGCNKSQQKLNDESEKNKFSFYCYPSFTKSYSFDFFPETRELEFNVIENISLADSLTPTSFTMMDSSRVKKIKEIIPLSNKFKIKISEDNNQKLKSILNELSNCDDKEYQPGIDGTTFSIVTKKNGKEKICKFWSPEMTKYGSKIGDVLDILLFELKSYPFAMSIVEHSAFRQSHSWRVLSEKPIYIRITNFEEDCTKFQKFVDKLPNDNEIYVDISNFRLSDGGECATKILRKKYKHLYWITDGFPTERNKFIDGK